MLLPEIGGQGHYTAVEQVSVFQYAVVEIVLCWQAECARLDPHVDVFRHQHDVAIRALLLQRGHYPQDLVVGFALRQAVGQLDVVQARLEEQAPLRIAVAEFFER